GPVRHRRRRARRGAGGRAYRPAPAAARRLRRRRARGQPGERGLLGVPRRQRLARHPAPSGSDPQRPVRHRQARPGLGCTRAARHSPDGAETRRPNGRRRRPRRRRSAGAWGNGARAKGLGLRGLGQGGEGHGGAAAAVRRGELVVLPTDTVYGLGADAFTHTAVAALLEAKGRGRDMPPPVLVGTVRAATALVEDLGPYGQDLIDAFWPGPLTIVCKANRALSWDLGDTKGTVALRMPLHPVALDLLKETGPMAVSSANRSGSPAAV